VVTQPSRHTRIGNEFLQGDDPDAPLILADLERAERWCLAHVAYERGLCPTTPSLWAIPPSMLAAVYDLICDVRQDERDADARWPPRGAWARGEGKKTNG
jgi:hypothetical protein